MEDRSHWIKPTVDLPASSTVLLQRQIITYTNFKISVLAAVWKQNNSFLSICFLFLILAVLEDEPEDDDLFETEFRQYKRTYYMTKMGVEVVSE